MGFDTSYQPIDLAFVQGPIAAYVAGKSGFDEWIDKACAREVCRFRAKAWSLGVLQASRNQKPSKVDSSLHVWGRPFLIASEEPAGVSAMIDRYLAAESVAEVDAIAKDQTLALGLENVEPDMESGPAEGDDLRTLVLRDLDVLPSVFAAVRKGARTIELPNGNEVDPVPVLAGSLPLLSVAFMARFRPGWMDRGHVWPTLLMSEAELPVNEYFEAPRALFGPLLDELPKTAAEAVASRLESSIVENYMVGGFVPAARVGPLRALLLENRDKLLAKPKEKNWDDECRVSLRKLDEALADAERRGLAFAEATEVYSGPLGWLN